jgi:YD repeat-containing protein
MTIAQQLKVTKFPFTIKDDNGNEIYYGDSDGWWKKREWDDKGNVIYSEDSNGFWSKYEYDDKGKVIYFEDNTGRIVDSRLKPVPEYTMEELVDKLGHNFKIKK